MPGLTTIPIIGDAIFMSKSLTLGSKSDWKDPPDMKQYSEAMSESSNTAPGAPQVPIPYFMMKMPNKLFSDTCKERGADFKKLHDDCLDAVKFSVDMWKLQAKFADFKINAVTALGAPDCLKGPELESNIKNAPMVAAYQKNWSKYRDAVAKGVSSCFKDWQGKVMVPGLPIYPAFAAWPGPMAPPMPNVPIPLIACPSALCGKIFSPSDMKSAMVDALDGGLKDKDKDKQHEALFEAIATVLALAFVMWVPMQQVMLVLGKGPVPSFAPPYVPVGPVVMGDNISAPGHCLP